MRGGASWTPEDGAAKPAGSGRNVPPVASSAPTKAVAVPDPSSSEPSPVSSGGGSSSPPVPVSFVLVTVWSTPSVVVVVLPSESVMLL